MVLFTTLTCHAFQSRTHPPDVHPRGGGRGGRTDEADLQHLQWAITCLQTVIQQKEFLLNWCVGGTKFSGICAIIGDCFYPILYWLLCLLLASWDIKQSLKPIITAAQVLKVEDAVDFCNRQFVHVHDRILILPTFTTFSGREWFPFYRLSSPYSVFISRRQFSGLKPNLPWGKSVQTNFKCFMFP